MEFKKENYEPRIIDQKIEKYLKIFGAICVEGPKWCGKTWSSLNHAKSVIYIGSSENNFQNRTLAQLSPDAVLIGETPRVIDEWQEVPALWDTVRFHVDQTSQNGNFILTGSATPKRKGIMHSGTGRIAKLTMRPMSLYESKDSNGVVSLKELFEKQIKPETCNNLKLEDLIRLAVRGGWPGSIKLKEGYEEIAKVYIKSVLEEDIYKLEEIKFDITKMERFLKSFARNVATLANNTTLQKDIGDIDVETIANYLDIFKRLFIIEEIPAYSPNIRSSLRVGKTSKKIFVDPSLACACLGVSEKKLLEDLNTFGFIFESMVLRDLLIYAESIGGKVYHYRDEKGREVDAIIETEDNKIGAFEIKLGANQIPEASKNLLNFKKIMEDNGTKIDTLNIICGIGNLAYQNEDGINIIPISSLKD